MTAGSVPSSAALCTLHVPSSSSKTYDADFVLRLVIQLAPPLQVKVVRHPAAGSPAGTPASLALQVGPHEHHNLIQQRNGIVRALCGMGLHASMDHKYRLLGGHVVKSYRSHASDSISVSSAFSMSSIVEWMAIAQDLRSGNVSSPQDVLERCESTLANSSYLVPNVPNATVADLDVAVAILTRANYLEQASNVPNVMRWLRQCHAELVRHGVHDVCNDAKISLLSPPSAPVKLPMFYSGTESITMDKAAKATAVPPKQTASNAKKAGTDDAAKAGGKGKGDAPAAAGAPSKDKGASKKDSKKEKAGGAPTAAAPSAAPADFTVGALDIRVGRIVDVWEHETADKLFCEVIDLGTETRKIASGLRPFYSLSDLQNRKVLVLCNLKARNLVGFPSHGMVLCASNDDHTVVEFVVPPPDAPLGSRIVFDGYEATVPEPESKVAKKKIFESVAPDLKTNEQGLVVWKGALARVHGLEDASGDSNVVKALNSLPNAKVS